MRQGATSKPAPSLSKGAENAVTFYFVIPRGPARRDREESAFAGTSADSLIR